MQQARKRNRLKEYDYSTSAYYFITTCVQDMIQCFGVVANEKMVLNEYGNIVEQCWLELDYYVVMPNHFHGIIILNPVGTGRDLSLQKTKRKSVSELMGVFKTTSSKQIHLAGLQSFKWQRSFYDRIIRNEKELCRILKYISQNPLRWDIEKNVAENIDDSIFE